MSTQARVRVRPRPQARKFRIGKAGGRFEVWGGGRRLRRFRYLAPAMAYAEDPAGWRLRVSFLDGGAGEFVRVHPANVEALMESVDREREADRP